ncbi:putative nuclease HARBI1 isoform X2 [Toxorhynchites rutilus septentrionalis]|uniref:putative nuclease HARBI1 isoform X2 n=1 Tax=Toxorhynchites rutilus septentrionalis TaxID=329112 RepID=UPI002478F154|nr:putative nuclease HARBI1 isoform X2 [Toxorhynchites rutilus septentrionalis]
MTRNDFKEVHAMIATDLEDQGYGGHERISTEEKLAVFLRFVVSGNSYRSMGYSYRMGERTISNIITKVSSAIWRNMQPIYLPEPTLDIWNKKVVDFQNIWQMPNTVGAIDGIHVTIKKPINSGSSFFNYKQHHSIVLLAVVDANYKFVFIDVGSKGRFPDGNIFDNCILKRKMMNRQLHLPELKGLPGREDIVVPYVIVGDAAFPLMENLMRPFPQRRVVDNYRNKVFNCRLSRARQTVECAFGILSSRFRIFLRPFEMKGETVNKIVMASCVLHNYLRTKSNTRTMDEEYENLPNFQQLLPLPRLRGRVSKRAFEIRDQFTDYFNSVEGRVTWQNHSVQRGAY